MDRCIQKTNGIMQALRLAALRKAGRLSVTMQTGCMVPLIRPGDRCQVELGITPLVEGDLVVFKRSDTYVLHRFLGRGSGGSFFHRGDADIPAEPGCAGDILIGRVISIVRGRREFRTDRPGFRFFSRFSTRLTRLEAKFFGTSCACCARLFRSLLLAVHRSWNTMLWSFLWGLGTRPLQ